MAAEICVHPWRFGVEPFRIADELFYVGSKAACCYLLRTDDGLVLIDAGFPQTVYLLLESVRRLGFDPRAIRLILNTHAHYDHIGGTRAVAELAGAATCLGRDDVATAAGRPELTEAELYGMEFHEQFEAARPLEDGEVVALGGARIRCLHTPGHTPGTMSYFFDVTVGGRRAAAGLQGGPGLAPLAEGYLARHGLSPSLRLGYWRSLGRLREQAVDIHLSTHPGQSRLFERAAAAVRAPAALVDSAAWPAYLDRLAEGFVAKFGRPEHEA